jgi:hypothetical protein
MQQNALAVLADQSRTICYSSSITSAGKTDADVFVKKKKGTEKAGKKQISKHSDI